MEFSKEEAGRAGAVGGDIAVAECDWVVVPNGVAEVECREKRDDGWSRLGRSLSDPSIEEMDMLLPGRCVGPGSRVEKDGDGCDPIPATPRDG